MGSNCIPFFKASCKAVGVTQAAAKRAVWGKAAYQSYWIGDDSKTITAHCIHCARAEAINEGLV